MKAIKSLSCSAILAAANIAAAAGYQIVEQGASNMGTAVAGAVANANLDATAAFWNPSAVAAMDLKVGETRTDSAVFAILPTLCINVDAAKSSPTLGMAGGSKMHDNCATNSIVPEFYLVHRFTENLYGTLSVTAPWGLESDYEADWIGNMQAMRSYLFTVDVNPSIAYKVNDWLTINGGVSCQFAYCTLSSMMPASAGMPSAYKIDLTGQGWSVGGNVGFTIQYAPDGRFGFQWRSAVEHTLTGNAHINGNTIYKGISADMHMPHTFTFGVYQRLRGCLSQFAVMADYSYTMWSAFDELYVPEMGLRVPENWKDTSRVSVGLHYYPEQIKDLTLRFGVCFDESPVRSATERTARIPCADRLWLSTGIGYTYKNFSIDLSYSYIFVLGNTDISRSETIGGMLPTHLEGNYFAHIHVLGIQLGMKF